MDLVVPLSDRVLKIQALAPEMRGESSAAPAAEVPEAVRDAAAEALARGETHYTDRPGILPLRQQVASMLQREFAVDVDAASGVVITCGDTEARFVSVQQLLPEGGTLVALANPERLAAACVVRNVTLLGPDDEPSGSVALYLNGTVSEAVAGDWLERARANGWPIVFETDAGGTHPAAVGLGEQTVTVGGIGQAHGMASWRLGFLAAPVAKAGPLRDFKQALTICSTSVSQWGAIALDGGKA